jgi:hypothetical protein
MTPTNVPPDPLLDRLTKLRRDLLDDTTAARTLARAEAALGPPLSFRSNRLQRVWVPAALAAWAVLYLWGAIGQLDRVFATEPAQGRALAALGSRAEDSPQTSRFDKARVVATATE